MFASVSGNEAESKTTVMGLTTTMSFAPIDLGRTDGAASSHTSADG